MSPAPIHCWFGWNMTSFFFDPDLFCRSFQPASQSTTTFVSPHLFYFISSLHWSHAGNSARLTWVRLQQPQEQRHPFLTVGVVYLCVQTKVWLPMLGILNVYTDVNACDCTRGLYGHRKSLHWKLTLGEKSLAPSGNRTSLSGVPVLHSTSWATSPP